jgi:hypothetical protein
VPSGETQFGRRGRRRVSFGRSAALVAEGVWAGCVGRVSVRAHFSPSRASRPAGCRSKIRGLVRCALACAGPVVIRSIAWRWCTIELARGTLRVTRHRPGRAFRRCPRSGLPDAVRWVLSASVSLWRGHRLSSAALASGRPTRPVLKHGPRSPACARVVGTH